MKKSTTGVAYVQGALLPPACFCSRYHRLTRELATRCSSSSLYLLTMLLSRLRSLYCRELAQFHVSSLLSFLLTLRETLGNQAGPSWGSPLIVALPPGYSVGAVSIGEKQVQSPRRTSAHRSSGLSSISKKTKRALHNGSPLNTVLPPWCLFSISPGSVPNCSSNPIANRTQSPPSSSLLSLEL